MSKQIEALKLALEYLRDNQHYIADNERHAYVMEYNAFVERLEALTEQPANVAAVNTLSEHVDKTAKNVHKQPAQQWNAGVPPLYPEHELGVSFKAEYEQPAQPAQPSKPWVGLTPSEIEAVLREWDYHAGKGGGMKRLVSITEAKLKERNT